MERHGTFCIIASGDGETNESGYATAQDYRERNGLSMKLEQYGNYQLPEARVTMMMWNMFVILFISSLHHIGR